MRKRSFVGIALAGAWLFLAQAAAAQGLQQELGSFGLLGNWAVRCAQPADVDTGNSHATYAMKGDRAELRYDFGPKYSNRVYTITAARRLAPDRLEIEHFDNADNVAQRTVIRKVEGRIQNFSAQELTGKVWIQNGIMLVNGRPAPFLEPCR